MTKFKFKPKKRIGNSRSAGLLSSIKQSAIEHGYNNRLGYFVFFLRRLLNNSRHLLARIAPFNKLRVSLHKARGVNIGKRVGIGPFVFIDEPFPEYVYIDDFAGIGPFSSIIAHIKPTLPHRNNYEAFVEPVIIGKGAWIGFGAIILHGVKVGEGSVVSAGSVVSHDVPPYTVVAGNPARPVKRLKED